MFLTNNFFLKHKINIVKYVLRSPLLHGPLLIYITSPSVSVASRLLFVRVRHYAIQLTAASRPFPPQKAITLMMSSPVASELHTVT